MNNNAHCNSDIGFSGPHPTFRCQCFQMVDLMMLHCKCTMNELNPCALPYEPAENNTNLKEENNSPSKETQGEKVEQQQNRIKKLMTGCNFGWKTPSVHATKKMNKQIGHHHMQIMIIIIYSQCLRMMMKNMKK